MTALIRRQPVGYQPLVRSPFNAISDWTPQAAFGASNRSTIGVDAFYDDDNFVVNASVPGVEPDQVNVTFDDGILKIEARREANHSEKRSDYVIQERGWGLFYRSLRLPDGIDIDGAQATVENGVLTVTIPRSETSRAKKLEVKSG